MNEEIAYCGLICHTCLIYLATREENRTERERMKAEIIQLCKRQYRIEYKPEDITDCDGCLIEGGKLFPPAKSCPIRECARQKELKNCSYCSEYVCKTLETFFASDPAAKIRLDEMRS